jgi:predicted metal-dependent peptidase
MSGAAALARIVNAKSRLLIRHPFYGVLASYMTPVECDASITETMAVDGKHLFFNPPFVDSLSDPELDFVTAHEASHLAYKHHVRMGQRDARQWNEAADFRINGDLVAQRVGTAPKGALIDPQFDGMGAEEIYAARAAQARKKAKEEQGQQSSPASGNASGGAAKPGNDASGKPSTAGAPAQGKDGKPVPGQGQAGAGVPHGMGGIIAPATAKEAEESALDWDIRVTRAASVAASRNAGTMPGDAARMVKEAREPVVDYRQVLADLINSRVASDYSFTRPNRRLISQGYYLPGLVVDGLEHLIFAVDTSGSMDATMLANSAAEVIGAMEGGKVQRLTVLFCDAAIRGVQEFEKGEDIKLAPRGGGGTRFSPVMRWIEENAPDATALVYLTDMECSDFGREPNMPVYWAIHGDSRAFDRLASRAPFGTPLYVGRLG